LWQQNFFTGSFAGMTAELAAGNSLKFNGTAADISDGSA